MRTMGQKETLDCLPDDNMAKRVINDDIKEFDVAKLGQKSTLQNQMLRIRAVLGAQDGAGQSPVRGLPDFFVILGTF